jgi:hypothetical protein
MSPWQRLYQTKLALLATLSMVAGLGLMVLARWTGGRSSWLVELPLNEVGATLFATGLIVIAFEYLDREDAEQRALLRLHKALRDEASAFRDAVVDGFAFKPDSLTNVASPATLDRIVRNCLAIRFNDRQLADELYADMSQQVTQAPERWRDVRVSVALSPWAGGPATGLGSMFAASVRWEFRVVPSSPVLRFSCVSDLSDYEDMRRDPTSTGTWYFEPVGDFDGASREAFQLLEVTVDGKPLRVRRSERRGSQIYAATLPEDVIHKGREVIVSYAYRVLVQRNGHVVHLDVSRPSKGLTVQFSYAACGIRHVNVLDYIASARRPRVSRGQSSGVAKQVEVAFDGWVFPKAGVAFVWVLDDETS